MAFTTISYRHVICPLWKEEISLRGKYLLSKEAGHTHEAKFLSATCPIVENLKLPQKKQDKRYALFRYCDRGPCELMKDFEPVIDTHSSCSQ